MDGPPTSNKGPLVGAGRFSSLPTCSFSAAHSFLASARLLFICASERARDATCLSASTFLASTCDRASSSSLQRSCRLSCWSRSSRSYFYSSSFSAQQSSSCPTTVSEGVWSFSLSSSSYARSDLAQRLCNS